MTDSTAAAAAAVPQGSMGQGGVMIGRAHTRTSPWP
jgi:hypothetical protein